MTCAVVLWVLLGTPAGYIAARFYKCEYKLFKMTRLKFIKVNYHHRTDFYFAVLFVVSLRASWRNVFTLTIEKIYRILM